MSDEPEKLVYRTYTLFVRDFDTVQRLKRLHRFHTLAEAISYLARQYGEPELQREDPEGLTVNPKARKAWKEPAKVSHPRRKRTPFSGLFRSA